MAKTTIDATFDVTIGEVPFTLEGILTIDGTAGSFVGGFGKPLSSGGFGPLAFDDAPRLKLNTFATLLPDLRSSLGVRDSFDPRTLVKAQISNVPGLAAIAGALDNAELRITVLSIDTATQEFTFGFGLGFASPLQLGPILFTAFGFTIQITAANPNGALKTT